MELEPTGERMIVEHYSSTPEDHVIYLLHIATYDFAERMAVGKRVLDYGCGSGYGSARIARVAASVQAVDVAPDAIAHARAHHEASNLSFDVIDPTRPLPYAEGSFDLVLSFQVLEHVRTPREYLAEIRRVLAPGGTLVLVTPDRSTRLLPLQRPWNRWHLHEYGSGELKRLIAPFFSDVRMLGMSGPPEMIGLEIRRCQRVKWLTLPFTLPFVPDALRVAALNLVHRLRGRPTGASAGTTQAPPTPFHAGNVVISENAAPSVNLVAIARKVA